MDQFDQTKIACHGGNASGWIRVSGCRCGL